MKRHPNEIDRHRKFTIWILMLFLFSLAGNLLTDRLDGLWYSEQLYTISMLVFFISVIWSLVHTSRLIENNSEQVIIPWSWIILGSIPILVLGILITQRLFWG